MNYMNMTTIPSLISMMHPASYNGFPYYDIVELQSNKYELRVALAGYNRSDIKVRKSNNQLHISASQGKEDTSTKYLHRGITRRDVERVFSLNKAAEVQDVSYVDGILSVFITMNTESDDVVYDIN